MASDQTAEVALRLLRPGEFHSSSYSAADCLGDLQSWPPKRNGTLIDATLLPSPSLPRSNPHPSSIGDDIWWKAEDAAGDIIHQFQPTTASDRKRNAVIEHLQWLITASVGGEVFPFGSVPLKTYLPDGDIDMTALSYKTTDDALAKSVLSVLEREEQKQVAEFEVKDIRYIKAEVQLIKCVVQNIIVDISFNQLGGLCTLYFLEQVDHLIGKDHLFKRSIMLIKAWCYYESRILGAHHNLISTYALEIMVLYIFNCFHLSLHGPLGVLYRFLDYFSKFDWGNYCLSINGPVWVASLPEIVVDMPGNDGNNLLLSKEFLQDCMDKFSNQSREVDNSTIIFSQKHFNIVDPLKESNNLGRSVNKGNFYRICSAFTYGAHTLGQILLLPGENILGELIKFFMNTLERHQSRQRPDAHGSCPFYKDIMFLGCKRSHIVSSVLDIQDSIDNEDIRYVSSKDGDLMGNTGGSKASNQSLDPCSNYDSDFKNLLYGKHYNDHSLCSPAASIPPVMPSQLYSKYSKNTLHQSAHLKPKVLQHSSDNAVGPTLYFPPSRYYLEDLPFTDSTSKLKETPKLGTGTYFPIMNHNSYKSRKAMNPSQPTYHWLPRPHINDGVSTTSFALSTPDRDGIKPPSMPVSEVPDFCGNGKGKHSGPSGFIPAGHQNRRRSFSNSIELSSADRIKFGTSRTSCLGAATLEPRRQRDSGAEQHMQCSGSLFQMPVMPSVEKERARSPYHLKEEDFPPLSVCIREGGKNVQIKA